MTTPPPDKLHAPMFLRQEAPPRRPGAHGLAVAALVIALASASTTWVEAAQGAVDDTIEVPGGIEGIARAAGLATDITPPRLLVELARLLHGRSERDLKMLQTTQDRERRETLSRVRAYLASAASGLRTATGRVPSLVGAEAWPRIAFSGESLPHGLFAAIAGDRRASLLYHGLAALDDETRTYFRERPELLARVTRQSAGAFGAFARSLHVRAGRVALPGGADAAPGWRVVLESDVSDTEGLIVELFGRREGRLAYFFDTVAHLDAPRLRFALGAGGGDESAGPQQFKALFDAFSNAVPAWRVETAPLERPGTHPALVLRSLAVAADGSLMGPAGDRFWSRVWENGAADLDGPADGSRVDGATIVTNVCQSEPTLARDRLETLQFVQRVFSAGATAETQALRAARAFPRFPALMLMLERMGVGDAAMYVAAADRAATLNDVEDEAARRRALAQFQGGLALVARAQFSGSVTPAETASLISSLVGIPVSRDTGYEGRVGQWIEHQLLEVASLGADAAGADAEERMLRLLAGAASTAPVIRWEDHLYRVDIRAAEHRRLRAIRQQQRSTSIDAALEAARGAGSVRADARTKADEAVADAVLGLVYAAHAGDPDGPIRHAPDLARRHGFGQRRRSEAGRLRSSWSLPQEQQGSVAPWHVSGSLLALDVALARLMLRRMSDEPPPLVPRLHGAERRTFIRTVAALNPRDALDADRDAIAAAIARGRERVAAIACRGDACVAPTDGATLDALMRDAALSAWRRAELRWIVAHAPERTARFFSLGELYWLGGGAPLQRPHAWGIFALSDAGCLCLRFPAPAPWEDALGLSGAGTLATRVPDLALRIAELLSELRLPSILARDTLAYATEEFLTLAQPAHPDDWTAMMDQAKALGRERVEDYISALTAAGPLVPGDGSADR